MKNLRFLLAGLFIFVSFQSMFAYVSPHEEYFSKLGTSHADLLIGFLESKDLDEVYAAAKRIGELRITNAKDRIRIWLNEADPVANRNNADVVKLREIYYVCIWTLGRIGNERDAVVLANKLMGLRDKMGQLLIIRALGELPKNEEALDMLHEFSEVITDERIGHELVETLLKRNDVKTFDYLKKMTDKSVFSLEFLSEVSNAARNISWFNREKDNDIVKGLESYDPDVIERMIREVGKRKIVEARSRVRVWFKESHPVLNMRGDYEGAKLRKVFQAAVWTLGQIGDEVDAELMASALRGVRDKETQILIIQTLENFPQSQYALDILNELTLYVTDERIAWQLLITLEKFDSIISYEYLKKMSERPVFSWRFRRSAIRLADKIRNSSKYKEKLPEILDKTLDKQDLDEVFIAIKEIGELGLTNSRTKVRAWLKESNPNMLLEGVQENAKMRDIFFISIWTISKIGDNTDAEILANIAPRLNDKESQIKVIRALGDFPDSAAALNTLNELAISITDERLAQQVIDSLLKHNSRSSYKPLTVMSRKLLFSDGLKSRAAEAAGEVLTKGR